MKGGVGHEGPSLLVIRTADQRVVGINNVLVLLSNESWYDIFAEESPGCGTLITPTSIIAVLQSRRS